MWGRKMRREEMTNLKPYYWQEEDLYLNLHVSPRAKKDNFAGLYGEHLRLQLAAVPKDGEANQHLIDFLATYFGVPKKQVSLLKGERSHNKLVKIIKPKKNHVINC
jgi:uncharacterized protein